MPDKPGIALAEFGQDLQDDLGTPLCVAGLPRVGKLVRTGDVVEHCGEEHDGQVCLLDPRQVSGVGHHPQSVIPVMAVRSRAEAFLDIGLNTGENLGTH
jgi:hypothetical protein